MDKDEKTLQTGIWLWPGLLVWMKPTECNSIIYAVKASPALIARARGALGRTEAAEVMRGASQTKS